MFTLKDFQYHANKTDFQRSNMFTVVFTSAPGSNATKTDSLLSKLDGWGNDLADSFGDGLIGGAISTATSYATQYGSVLMSSMGMNRGLLGASNNKIVETIAGSFDTTAGLLDLGRADFKFTGLMAYNVQMPESRIGYEMDRFHNAPGVKIMSREFDPLVIGFRMDSAGKSYKAMLEWNHSVEDPHTGLRALPQEVSADIQVILYDRNMRPKTIYAFKEILPMTVSAPELSYDSDNQISTFDVTFAYRSMEIVDVPSEKGEKFLANMAGEGISMLKGTEAYKSFSSSVSSTVSSGVSSIGDKLTSFF